MTRCEQCSTFTPDHSGEEYKKLRDLGFKFCLISYYSSSVDNLPVSTILSGLQNCLPPHSFFQIKNFEARPIESVSIQRHCIRADREIHVLHNRGFLNGRYVVIVSPWQGALSSIEANSIREGSKNFSGLLSLIHGSGFAWEQHTQYVLELDTDVIHFQTNEIYDSGDVVKELNVSDQITAAIADIRPTDIDNNPLVLNLISRAHHESDPTIKFLWYWIAIEASIGKGEQRKRFAKMLRSKAIGEFLNHIREKRGEVVHDGQTLHLTFFELILLKIVLLIRLCQNDDHRMRLVMVFEQLWSDESDLKDIEIFAHYSIVSMDRHLHKK